MSADSDFALFENLYLISHTLLYTLMINFIEIGFCYLLSFVSYTANRIFHMSKCMYFDRRRNAP